MAMAKEIPSKIGFVLDPMPYAAGVRMKQFPGDCFIGRSHPDERIGQ